MEATAPDAKVQAARHRVLAMAALGVVFGDIGTSPLYMMRETLGTTGGLQLNEQSVFGVLSLAFWSLMIIVSIKYCVFIMRADNKGEGGVLSLASLALRAGHSTPRRRRVISFLALLGLALFYGDALITPSVSVLSAVEGLSVATDAFDSFVVPIATVILVLLFLFQSRGTHGVGRLFGPVMALWFVVLGLLGFIEIFERPDVLAAIIPFYAVDLIVAHPWTAFVAMGSVVLCVTGAEALYADMGHFGRGPIRTAWIGVSVCLVLNYFGQGALLLEDPTALDNPFYKLAPGWALYPMVALSTCATVIASQAVISGVFSLTRQAIQLGYLPRMDIRHTSATEMGQIYIPQINWLLMAGVAAIVITFGTSSALTHAYGLAVTGAMTIDTILGAIVARWLWGWNRWLTYAVFGAFFIVDFTFFASNTLKIPTGGWFPIVAAIACLMAFRIWNRGREILLSKLYRDAMPMREFLQSWDRTTERVSGTAVFMTSNPTVVPTAFLHNLKHNHVVHERVVLMKVMMEDIPRVADANRIEIEKLGKGFHSVIVHYGFIDRPDVPRALELCRQFGLSFDLMQTTFFLGRETLIPASRSELRRWQAAIFIAMQATALSATRFFRIPANRVVEMGTQVEI
ncbi:MAG: potassium transporter Kup [Alphaproteobacteria bacterium]|nr:potassium transporter Kup [Alphaproteobacteria bacterium]